MFINNEKVKDCNFCKKSLFFRFENLRVERSGNKKRNFTFQFCHDSTGRSSGLRHELKDILIYFNCRI